MTPVNSSLEPAQPFPRHSRAAVTDRAGKKPMQKREDDMIAIYRVFSEERQDYFWLVTLKRASGNIGKPFFFKHYGGEQEALVVARIWRDKMDAKFPLMKKANYCAVLRANNKSGICGVNRLPGGTRLKNGTPVFRPYWCANIPLGDGKKRTARFPIRKYGEEGAKQLAIAARMDALAALGEIAFKAVRVVLAESTPDEITQLDAKLHATKEKQRVAELRARRQAEKERRDQERASKAADLLTQAQETEQRFMQQENASGHPYIHRFSNVSGGGWKVFIGNHHKSFSDAAHDGKDKALREAIAWRDKVFFDVPVQSRAQRAMRAIKTNTSGTPGVRRVTIVRKGGKIAHDWKAFNPDSPGQRKRSKSFSTEKYGEQEAFAMAVEARAAFVAELGDEPALTHAAKRLLREVAPNDARSAQRLKK